MEKTRIVATTIFCVLFVLKFMGQMSEASERGWVGILGTLIAYGFATLLLYLAGLFEVFM